MSEQNAVAALPTIRSAESLITAALDTESVRPRFPRIEIEFSTGCHRELRAGWISQELLVTFGHTLGEIALVPHDHLVFRVKVNGDVVWNFNPQRAFPVLKELKQSIRNIISPGMNLGHSDSKPKEGPPVTVESGSLASKPESVMIPLAESAMNTVLVTDSVRSRRPRVEIEYCTGCRWGLRAGWMSQELLVAFGQELGEVTVVPGKEAVFRVTVNGEVVWDRKTEGRFPEMDEVQPLVRDIVRRRTEESPAANLESSHTSYLSRA